MTPELEQDPKFEALRNLPTELSQDQVFSIIATLPALPIGNSWIDLLYSKSIAMKTIIVSLIASGAAYFAIPNEAHKPITESNNPIEIADTIPEGSNLSMTIPVIPSPDSIKEKNVLSEIPQPAEIDITEQAVELVDTIDTSLLKTNKRLGNLDSPEPSIFDQALTLEESILPDNDQEFLIPKLPAEPDSLAPDSTRRIKVNGELNYANGYPGYSNLKVGRIKKTLLKSLLKDQLINSREEDNVMQLLDDKIILNGKMLDPVHYKKYDEMLKGFGIVHTGPYHQVRVANRYIMMGDFGPKGFRGRAKGKNMQLDISINDFDTPLIE